MAISGARLFEHKGMQGPRLDVFHDDRTGGCGQGFQHLGPFDRGPIPTQVLDGNLRAAYPDNIFPVDLAAPMQDLHGLRAVLLKQLGVPFLLAGHDLLDLGSRGRLGQDPGRPLGILQRLLDIHEQLVHPEKLIIKSRRVRELVTGGPESAAFGLQTAPALFGEVFPAFKIRESGFHVGVVRAYQQMGQVDGFAEVRVQGYIRDESAHGLVLPDHLSGGREPVVQIENRFRNPGLAPKVDLPQKLDVLLAAVD